ncbi:MAG: DUF4252 domain-containing protein [Bacteroidales bacterium]|nr:DUF4252 domain-containing protein [Lentimicrobiaceae bacterium]MDD5695789.1 DUF4252 domain-containing protein [Bacteroidales bacterium]
MKTLVFKTLLILLLCSPVLLSAQNSPMDKLFQKYAGKDCFTSVSISKDMFQLFSDIEGDKNDKDFEEFQGMISQLDGLRILTYSEENDCKGINFYEELTIVYPLQKYTELMVVQEKDEMVNFYILKEGNKIPELLMIAREPGETVVLSLTGNIDLSYISKLGKSMKIEGLDNLEKIEEEK